MAFFNTLFIVTEDKIGHEVSFIIFLFSVKWACIVTKSRIKMPKKRFSCLTVSSGKLAGLMLVLRVPIHSFTHSQICPSELNQSAMAKSTTDSDRKVTHLVYFTLFGTQELEYG